MSDGFNAYAVPRVIERPAMTSFEDIFKTSIQTLNYKPDIALRRKG